MNKSQLLPNPDDFRLVLYPNGDIVIYSCRSLQVVYQVKYQKGDEIHKNMLIALLIWEQKNREGSFIPKDADYSETSQKI